MTRTLGPRKYERTGRVLLWVAICSRPRFRLRGCTRSWPSVLLAFYQLSRPTLALPCRIPSLILQVVKFVPSRPTDAAGLPISSILGTHVLYLRSYFSSPQWLPLSISSLRCSQFCIDPLQRPTLLLCLSSRSTAYMPSSLSWRRCCCCHSPSSPIREPVARPTSYFSSGRSSFHFLPLGSEQ